MNHLDKWASYRADGTVDGATVAKWALKKEAVAAARAISWPLKCVREDRTRFQVVWTLHGTADEGIMTRALYEALLADYREHPRAS